MRLLSLSQGRLAAPGRAKASPYGYGTTAQTS